MMKLISPPVVVFLEDARSRLTGKVPHMGRVRGQKFQTCNISKKKIRAQRVVAHYGLDMGGSPCRCLCLRVFQEISIWRLDLLLRLNLQKITIFLASSPIIAHIQLIKACGFCSSAGGWQRTIILEEPRLMNVFFSCSDSFMFKI